MHTTETESNKKNGLSFILYGKNGVPRYYRISKSSLYLYLTAPSLIGLVLLISLFGLMFYFSKIKNMASQKDPETIQLLKRENEEIRKEVIDLSETNKNLQEKLSNLSTIQKPTDSNSTQIQELWDTISVFKTPMAPSTENFPTFSIEDHEALVQGQKINFRFNIVNLSKDAQKLSGHIFVIMRDDSGVYFYPNNVFDDSDIKIAFNRGESFATTKFRPVEASFPRPSQSSKFIFKVVIFSRTGSLIYKQVFPQDIKL